MVTAIPDRAVTVEYSLWMIISDRFYVRVLTVGCPLRSGIGCRDFVLRGGLYIHWGSHASCVISVAYSIRNSCLVWMQFNESLSTDAVSLLSVLGATKVDTFFSSKKRNSFLVDYNTWALLFIAGGRKLGVVQSPSILERLEIVSFLTVGLWSRPLVRASSKYFCGGLTWCVAKR